MLKAKGGWKENKSKPAVMTVDGDGITQGNIVSVFDADENHLGDIAYRPHEIGKSYCTAEGLFLC